MTVKLHTTQKIKSIQFKYPDGAGGRLLAPGGEQEDSKRFVSRHAASRGEEDGRQEGRDDRGDGRGDDDRGAGHDVVAR